MTQGRFFVWLSAVFAIMSMTRLSLEPQSAEYLLINRPTMINLTVATVILSVLSLCFVRLQETNQKLTWLIATFFWLVACEPVIRLIVGGAVPASVYPGPASNWADIPLMLCAFLLFLGIFEGRTGPKLAPLSEKAHRVAGWVAVISLMSRPHVVISGLDQLPFIGDNLHVSTALLAGSMQIDFMMLAIKGLFVGADWFGNGIMLTVFAGSLMLLVFSERIHAGDPRRHAMHA